MDVLKEIKEEPITENVENIIVKQETNNTIETLKKLLESNDNPELRKILEKEQKNLLKKQKKEVVKKPIKDILSDNDKKTLIWQTLDNHPEICSFTKLHSYLKKNGSKILISRDDCKLHFTEYKKDKLKTSVKIPNNFNETINQTIKENINKNISQSINETFDEKFKSFEDRILEQFKNSMNLKKEIKKVEKIEPPIIKSPIVQQIQKPTIRLISSNRFRRI